MEPPRNLTPEEIEDVVSVLGTNSELYVRSPIGSISSLATENVKADLRKRLAKLSIVPQGLDELKEDIKKKFLRSRIEAGTPVGFQVSEAIGGPATQMSLNAFHTAGAGGPSQGIERIQQLVDLTKHPKVVMVSAYFEERLNYESAYFKIRREIIGVYVGNLTSDEDVESVDIVTQDRPWWYEAWEEIYGPVPETDYILRLTMDVKSMLSHGVTMRQAAEAIESGNKATVKAVFSPQRIGIIDVYPIRETLQEAIREYYKRKKEELSERQEGEINEMVIEENAANFFLNSIVLPNLKNVYVKGIEGVTRATPMFDPVLSIVEEEIPYPEEEDLWILVLSRKRMFLTGINREMLSQLVEAAGLEIIVPEEEVPEYLIVYSPGERPRKVIESKDLELAKHYYIEIEGGKYSSILSLEGVRPELTTSNNIHDIYEVLGIEAARKFYVQEFYNLFVMQGMYIFTGHLELMGDFVTNMGILSAINTTGIGRQAIGSLAKATYRKPMDIMYKAGMAGELSSVNAVSTSVLLGERARIGTGYVQLVPDRKKEAEILASLGRNELNISAIDLEAGVDALDEMVSGGKVFALSETDLDMMFSGSGAPPLAKVEVGTQFRATSTERTSVRPTPSLSPIEQIRPLGIISDNLMEVAPLISQIPVYTEEKQVTVSAVEQPSLGSTISNPRDNPQSIREDMAKVSSKLSSFSFVRRPVEIKRRETQRKSTAEMLAEL